MCVQIELVGGAADGRRLTLCGDPTDPTRELQVAERVIVGANVSLGRDPDTGQPNIATFPTFRVFIYARDPEPTRAKEGPQWLYRQQPTPSA
ncbi:hypothetical protein HCJ76_43945 [Streptomyces sp. MC1]|uniref:hypothetical protein n=1 Tax=Streptomyces sp. MC1 TaxID=295105 RepID=UPI0018C9484E|nr:hypothetical protein [Streptomyces sp. MC1]MBG7704836.1 hypothetical protein [Streptomyces sp. MC1]